MKDVLKRYLEKKVLINVDDPVKSKQWTLFLVSDDIFGVLNTKDGFRAYYPYTSILGVYESMDGNLQINVNHFVLYKGSRGFGFSF